MFVFVIVCWLMNLLKLKLKYMHQLYMFIFAARYSCILLTLILT